jgi:aspartyl-tRNA(Asn)/glutamyl-tRNA(Gln) amidotransferase subunit B
MPELEPVIGLEIHVQLDTRTKMFCGCELSFGEEPNTRTCPVCLGLPGTLPVVNAQAIQYGLMMGLALGCELAPRSIFHRKNYFYPDLAKGYQISQYDIPLCSGGRLGDVRLHRIHLEEDAAKLVHVGESGRIHGSDASIVDYNRGGTPLAEIVTEPDIHSPEQAREWLNLLRVTLRQLGVSDVNMEEGSLRADANVSVRPVGSTALGTKTELKNMNSFRFLEQGIKAEIARQSALVEAGEPVVQETLHFDPGNESAPPLRSKEEAQDYRYFPEPDLVPLEPDRKLVERLRVGLPELPWARIRRLEAEIGFTLAEGLVTSGRDELYSRIPGEREAVANVVMNELAATGVEPADVNAEELGKVIAARADIPRAAFAEALAASGDKGFSAERYLAESAIADVSELDPVIDRILGQNQQQVEAYRGGKEGLLGFFVGQVMKETGGKANPKVVNERVREKLNA